MPVAQPTQVDEYCNQPLRATLSTEEQSGPDYWLTVQVGSGLGRMVLQRWPITQIVAVNVAASAGFPTQWTAVPAGYWRIERPPMGLYGTNAPSGAGEGGQAVLIAPSYVNWCQGRNGLRVQVQYIHGWPHAGLTTQGTAGTSALAVDDCTGWGPAPSTSGSNQTGGATGVIYDGASQETIHVTAASVTAGPGHADPRVPDHLRAQRRGDGVGPAGERHLVHGPVHRGGRPDPRRDHHHRAVPAGARRRGDRR